MNRLLTATTVKAHLQEFADPTRAHHSQKFFKTGKGHYAEGDIFIGIPVPALRKIACAFKELPLQEISSLLASPINEERLVALFILVTQYKKAKTANVQQEIYDFYFKHIEHINNWNLVDSSAYCIVGTHLYNMPKDILITLAHSSNIWHRRIAIVATMHFIKQNHFATTFELALILIDDPHDLLHKAVGWMLREIGKQQVKALEGFLDHYAAQLPRTALRYALEKLPPDRKQFYMKKPSTKKAR